MNMKEFYDAIGVDYGNVIRRLQRDQLIEKYLGMILKDNNFSRLENAVAAGDHEEIYHAAHTIKGMALNLELTPLAKAAADLSDYMKLNQASADKSAVREKAAKVKREFETIQHLLS